MSNKYYWEGVDITDITGTTSTNTSYFCYNDERRYRCARI